MRKKLSDFKGASNDGQLLFPESEIKRVIEKERECMCMSVYECVCVCVCKCV